MLMRLPPRRVRKIIRFKIPEGHSLSRTRDQCYEDKMSGGERGLNEPKFSEIVYGTRINEVNTRFDKAIPGSVPMPVCDPNRKPIEEVTDRSNKIADQMVWAVNHYIEGGFGTGSNSYQDFQYYFGSKNVLPRPAPIKHTIYRE